MRSTELIRIEVGDAPEPWEKVGFAVHEETFWVDGVLFELTGRGGGIRTWELSDRQGTATGLHPNGAVALDHFVILTPDLDHSIEMYEGSGLELRRVRDAGEGRKQAFFRIGRPILEVVGPVKKLRAPKLWGLTFTVRDLDRTADLLGPLLHPAKDAVQPGRRIATVGESAGLGAAVAFMSQR